jgi:DNA-binding CsgD family transcriptional regulator
MIPFDAAVWLATDPATSLPAAPTLSDGLRGRELGHADCVRLWEREFLVDDANLFRDLARAETPAAGLRIATRGRPARSVRFRELLRPWGFADELRAMLRVDGHAWASLALMREEGRPAFGAREVELVARLSAPLAAAVRDHAQPPPRPPSGARAAGAGLLLFTADGQLRSVNDDALHWLEELAWLDDSSPGDAAWPAAEVRLPLLAASTIMRARAVAERGDHRGTARSRIHSERSGRWLVCHATCLRGADGELGDIALVIEPASAAEIAPIFTQAYGLTRRERQITELIAQGARTAEIAGRLHLSTHTVRDHVKAIFEKAGVSSRGELVATLFAEHYAPLHASPDAHGHVG